jgi:hypothetical protein
VMINSEKSAGANNSAEHLLFQYFFLNLKFSDRTSSDTLYFYGTRASSTRTSSDTLFFSCT